MFQKLWPFNSSSQQNGSPQTLEPQDHGTSTKVKPIHASFNKGIPLNMKIVIRGDIRTGKTSVFERLQGLPFRNEHEYQTTEQIQVANIPWQYPHTKDIIKVEIWDVVDKGVQSAELKAPSNGVALKIDNNPPTSPTKARPAVDVERVPHAEFALDASTIDVYRNTDGVILMYDISKLWTFEYAARALDEIPINMPVLILSNFTDDSHPRPVVANEQLETLINEHNDARCEHPCAPANLIRHLETSMKTGLGLKEIHEGFGIPFLNVLRETHRKQFEQKTREIQELLKAMNRHAQERPRPSIQQPKQEQHPQSHTAASAAQPLSHNDVTSPRRQFNSAPIQTTGALISPIPQTSSPTSPARKTRNEHINVQIISPTPVSAQTPAVLFDFNAGSLEEDFFSNVELNPASAAAARSTDEQGGEDVSLSLVTSAEPSLTEDDDIADVDRNPMVAGDEDIEPDSRNELAYTDSHQVQIEESIWTPEQEDVELMNRPMAKYSKETHLEEILEADENEYSYNNAVDENEYSYSNAVGENEYSYNNNNAVDEPANDSETSFGESIRPLRLDIQQDSDVESQSDFPVASAMYYEHEPSAFVRDDDDDDNNSNVDDESKAVNASVLASYGEIAEYGRRENPWDSTGNLLRGIASPATPAKDTYRQDGDQEEQQVTDDKYGDSSPVMTAQSNGMVDLSSRKIAVDVNTNLPSADTSGATAEEPGSAATVSTEGSGVDIEDNEGDDEEVSPTTATDEKKKTKKKGKKKSKKNK